MEFSESSLVFSFWTARPLGTEQSGALSASLSIRQSELMSLTCSNSAVRLNSKQASLLCSRHGCVGTQKIGQSLAHWHSSADTAEPTEYHICTRHCWAEYHIIFFGEACLSEKSSICQLPESGADNPSSLPLHWTQRPATQPTQQSHNLKLWL